MIREGLFRFVRWHDVARYHRRGWMVAGDLGPRHGQYSALMWHCDCGQVSP